MDSANDNSLDQTPDTIRYNAPGTAPQYDTRLAYTSSLSLRIVIAVTLLYAFLRFIGSPLVPPVYTVSTEQILPANLTDSWRVLTDFAAYPEWNPYLTAITGEFQVGEKVALTLLTERSPQPRRSHATLAKIEPQTAFAWRGQQFPIPGFSHTRHVFALERIDDTHTRLRHYEEFRGLGVALDSSGRKADIQNNERAFAQMNKALAARLAGDGHGS